MKLIFNVILIGVFLLISTGMKAQTGNQDVYAKVKPRKQKLELLPFGTVKPSGWLKTQMQHDLDGFVGHLDELVPDLMSDKIYGADRLSKSSKSKDLGNIGPALDPQYLWWNSETQSNWRDGFIRNAILLGDSVYLAKTEEYIKYILSTQDEDGYLGVYSKDLRYKFTDENGELWAKTTLLRGLLAWYEYTQRPEILQSVVKAVDNVMANYPINASSPFKSTKPFAGGVTHGLVFTDICDRLYQLTSDEKYLEYALFLYKDFSENVLSEDAQYAKIMDPAYKLTNHGVHTYEHLRPLALAYFTSGNPQLKKALDSYLQRIAACTTPSGGPIGDEWVGGRTENATSTGYEYCSMQELMDGYISLMQKSGDAHFGELAEHLFLNAAQGARLQDKSAIAYCKTDNSFEMKGIRNGEIQKGENQTRYKYSPAHQDVAVCCVPNAGRIAPYFVKSMWMKDQEGLVSTLLGPCEVNTDLKGVNIKITEETAYPFSNSIDYHISVGKPVSFTLKIRRPVWAKNVKLNCTFTENEGYIVITKTWKKNTTISLQFSSDPQIKQDQNRENYFTYGALVFALPIESKQIVTKNYPVARLADLEYEPLNLVKYRLSASDKPQIKVSLISGSDNVWNFIELQTLLLNEKTGEKDTVYLKPLGATILRQETFKNQVQTAFGSIRRLENFKSAFVNPRNIDIWLPDGYDPAKKYPVLYMHDGQMLFDSTTTWNHLEWGVDETLGRLIKENKIKECIVVGIWNTNLRHAEYFPQKALEYLTDVEKTEVLNTTFGSGKQHLLNNGPLSDNYLKFVVKELKPFIDSCFSTLKDPGNTFIAGSSMGGLISMYAICEYPQVFGGAACLSTHWPGTFKVDNNPVPAAFTKYMKDYLPLPKNHKLYFDYGTETLDSNYKPTQQQVDKILKSKGYTSVNWITKEFLGDAHTETAWNTRFYVSVTFLLGK